MTDDYDDSNIRVLEGLEAVRVRPGMYIGSTGSKGLHHLVYEVVDNSIEEALAGHCQNIDISINANGSITVADDGRGIATGINPQTGNSNIERVLTVQYGGYPGSGYPISGGLHGIGITVVNALSSELEVKVWRNQKIYTQRFGKGFAVSELEVLLSPDERTGTKITFLPDIEIFTDGIEFDFDTLASQFKELAYLQPGIRIGFTDYRSHITGSNTPKVEHYYFEGGIRDYIADLIADKQRSHPEVIYIQGEQKKVRVEVALQWCIDTQDDCILGFANFLRTIDGGEHINGLKVALTRTLNSIAHQQNKLRSADSHLSGKGIRAGLVAIVSVMLPNPEWEGSTRAKLANPEVREIVDSIVSEALTVYLASHPDVADAIIDRSIQTSHRAELAKKERELNRLRSRKTPIEPGTHP
jgi:DNA gyrase subunit B